MRSPERGKALETFSNNLNATTCLKFRVTPRSVRDRYNLLIKKLQAKLTSEEKASGINATNSELDDLLEEIVEKEKAAREKLDFEDEIKMLRFLFVTVLAISLNLLYKVCCALCVKLNLFHRQIFIRYCTYSLFPNLTET